jgi:hypothetical protein
MNRELRKFQTNSHISQLNINIYTIFSILFSALLAFMVTEDYFCKMNNTELFEDLNEKIDSIPISSFIQIFILNSYHISWFIAIQLLYIGLKTRYITSAENYSVLP